MPLPTLRLKTSRLNRKTQGQDGVRFLLSCKALSSSTTASRFARSLLNGLHCFTESGLSYVLEYEHLQPGEFTFEDHTNYVGEGATVATQSLLHITYELTAGLTDHFSLGAMQLNARAPRGPLESAGWRLVPHLYVPRSWHWPLDIGIVAEFSLNNPIWTPDSRSVELLAILEKRFGRIQIDLNPDISRSLHGPDTMDHRRKGPAASGFKHRAVGTADRQPDVHRSSETVRGSPNTGKKVNWFGR